MLRSERMPPEARVHLYMRAASVKSITGYCYWWMGAQLAFALWCRYEYCADREGPGRPAAYELVLREVCVTGCDLPVISPWP